MKILVGIANYGSKNIKYLNILIKEYKSMPFDVDIVVFSNIAKTLTPDIELIVGLASREPWSLPFAHKKVFSERAHMYDLFIYTEDDILITERNINAFLTATDILSESEIAGFMRYEIDNNGRKSYPDIHKTFHWELDSIKTVNGLTYAHFNNHHSACYILTKNQLSMAIKSGGYLLEPYSRAPGKFPVGRYDIACSAATDPYTKCGLKKLICVTLIQDFLVHHLSNAYVDKEGIDSTSFNKQIDALLEIAKNGEKKELFETQKTKLNTIIWDKNYYEPCNYDILKYVPPKAKKVLSVGCGWGATEEKLIEMGKEVTAIPLDYVISKLAEMRGIKTLPENFEKSYNTLESNSFDCIIFYNILQHLENPINIIKKSVELISSDGLIIGSVPNFRHLKVYKSLILMNISFAHLKNFAFSGLHPTTKKMIKYWLKQCELKCTNFFFIANGKYKKYADIAPLAVKPLLASDIVFVCKKL